jgi:hypothetical protein
MSPDKYQERDIRCSKSLPFCFCLGSQAVSRPLNQQPSSPLTPSTVKETQAQAVLRILTMTDPLDQMIRAGNAGPPFVDLAKEVEIGYLKYRNKFPANNAMPLGLRRIAYELKCVIDNYSVANTLIDGKVQNSNQTPFDQVAQVWTIQTMLRKILQGQAKEREWQVFEAGDPKTRG